MPLFRHGHIGDFKNNITDITNARDILEYVPGVGIISDYYLVLNGIKRLYMS